MKTIEEFYKELEGSEELQKDLAQRADKAALEAFFKDNGCGFTAEEYLDHLSSLKEGELSDDESEAVAGGFDFFSQFPMYKCPKCDRSFNDLLVMDRGYTCLFCCVPLIPPAST